jgi:hypothetical protein
MNTPKDTYQKLDRAALWLIIGEFCVAGLLMCLTFLLAAGSLASSGGYWFDYGTGEAVALGIALLYILAYLGNVVIGVWGLLLYALDHREGYPGTGHLINWVFLAATVVIVLFVFVLVIGNL